MKIEIQETWVNKTKGYQYGASAPYETWADHDQKGELFRDLQKVFGRCTSSIYIDHALYGTLKIGWVFEKNARYEDTNEPFLQETWIELTNTLP